MELIPCKKTSYTAPGMSLTSLKQILEDVGIKTGISVEELKDRTRKREITDARYVYFRRAKALLGEKVTLNKIGLIVSRDHATVLHGLREAENTKEINDLYKKLYD